MSKTIRKTYKTQTKAKDNRSLVVRISTKSPDRSKDIVQPKGVKLKNYKRNPVVALNHNYSGLPIAKTTQIKADDKGINATVQFPKKGVHKLSDTVYDLYKGGFMNAWSIGFMPDEVIDRKEGGREYKSWELLEYSAVLVPDNPEALTLVRSKGYDFNKKGNLVKSKKKTKKVKKTKDVKKKTKKVNKSKSDVKALDEDVRNDIKSTMATLKVMHDKFAKLLEATPKEPTDKSKTEINLVEGLKLADKTIGIALRNYKNKG